MNNILTYNEWIDKNNIKTPKVPTTAWGKKTYADSSSLIKRHNNAIIKFREKYIPLYIQYVNSEFNKNNKFDSYSHLEDYARLLASNNVPTQQIESLLIKNKYKKINNQWTNPDVQKETENSNQERGKSYIEENKAIHAWYAANPSKDKLKKKETKHKRTKSSANQIRSIR